MKSTPLYSIKHKRLKKFTMRKDHYDGQNALNRFSAEVSLDNRLDTQSLNKMVNNLVWDSKKWMVSPDEIIIFTNRIEIHWYAKAFQMVVTQEQYLELIQEFISFIKNIQNFKLTFLERCLIEDPNRLVWSAPNEVIQFNTSFCTSCFCLNEHETRVLFLNERLEGVA
ncbi:hypothetical protein [Paraliobacillus zengyii]|uniref:hypothetical protein n=1 Tax=Paraliobacillus zengyii TaxID=2213194 RepID=UPI000DD3B900|nr:hypothetical protein [Paraliobacillus zengyii]